MAIYVLGNENRHTQGGENMYVSAPTVQARSESPEGWGGMLSESASSSEATSTDKRIRQARNTDNSRTNLY